MLRIIQANRDQNFPPTGMVCRGVARNLFRRGQKGFRPSPAGPIHGLSPGWDLGASPRNPINMLKIRFNVKNSAVFREKIFSIGNLSLCPLPYAPDGLKKFRPALVLSWTMERPKVTIEGWEMEGAKRRSADWLNLNQNWDAYHLKATYFQQAAMSK